jgi:hypothetical protein
MGAPERMSIEAVLAAPNGGDSRADRNWRQSLSVIGPPSRGSLIRLERLAGWADGARGCMQIVRPGGPLRSGDE